MTAAHDLIALNEYTDHDAPEAGKVAELVESMTANGWQGAPVLTYDGIVAVTGTHRIAAAREAGIDVPTLDLADVVSECVIAAVMADNDWASQYEITVAILLASLDADEYGIDGDSSVYVDEEVLAA